MGNKYHFNHRGYHKMKYVVFLFVVMVSVMSAPVQANVAQALCEYVAVDDKKRLRSFLKTNKLKIRSIFKGVQCNNMNLLHSPM